MTGRRTARSLAATLAAALLLGLLPSVAHAAEGDVTATFNPNGGTVSPATMEVAPGTPATAFPRPSRDRYNFAGWFTAASGGEKLATAPATDFTAYAQWNSVAKLTVKFDTNGGGEPPPDQKVSYDKAFGTMPTVRRAHYAFTGWYTKDGRRITSTTKVTTKATVWLLVARWVEARRYNFDANGGTTPTEYKDVAPGKALGTLPTPKRSWYTFMGWYTKREHGGSKRTSSSSAWGSPGESTLYARWAPKAMFQFDSRWRYLSYVSTMRGSGCGLTAMSIVVRAISRKDTTPRTARRYALDHDYDIRKPGRTKAGFFTKWPAKYGIKVTPTNSHTAAREAVKNGNWVVAFMKPGRWTREGHFIVWYDYSGSNALIRDPNATKASKVKAPISTLQSQTWTGVSGNKHHRYYIVEVPDSRKLYKVG